MMEPISTLALLYKNRYVIALFFVLMMLVSFYGYYTHASSRIESLERDNILLNNVIQQQQRQIEIIQKNYEQIVRAKDELFEEVEKIKQTQKNEEEKIFRENQKKKSLEELAIKKSKLVQNAVNKATQRAFECFETLSEGGNC